jgi:hypothetical protein
VILLYWGLGEEAERQLLEGSQVSPARPSHKGGMKMWGVIPVVLSVNRVIRSGLFRQTQQLYLLTIKRYNGYYFCHHQVVYNSLLESCVLHVSGVCVGRYLAVCGGGL